MLLLPRTWEEHDVKSLQKQGNFLGFGKFPMGCLVSEQACKGGMTKWIADGLPKNAMFLAWWIAYRPPLLLHTGQVIYL